VLLFSLFSSVFHALCFSLACSPFPRFVVFHRPVHLFLVLCAASLQDLRVPLEAPLHIFAPLLARLLFLFGFHCFSFVFAFE
jgi:hypothetical protein